MKLFMRPTNCLPWFVPRHWVPHHPTYPRKFNTDFTIEDDATHFPDERERMVTHVTSQW